MIVWAVANQKGGVGKTTTAVSLGGQLIRRGYRTLLIDMDAHGSLTCYFGYNPDVLTHSLYDLFNPEIKNDAPEQLIRKTKFKDLWLLPATTALATLDRQLGGVDGMGLVISRTMSKLSQQFDAVLIDCPPQLGVLMVNALAACESLIIPVQTEFLALKGLQRMQHTLAMFSSAKHKPINYVVVPTLYDQRTRASIESLQAIRSHGGKHVWPSYIPVDTLFRDASRLGVPLPLQKPGARGSKAYARLLQALLKRRSKINKVKLAVA